MTRALALLLIAAACGGGGSGRPLGTTRAPRRDAGPMIVAEPRPVQEPPPDLPPLAEIDVEKYVVAIELDVPGAAVWGTTRVQARVTRPGRVVALDFDRAGTIESVSGVATRHRHDGDVLYLVADAELPIGPIEAVVAHRARMNPAPAQCGQAWGGLMRTRNLHGDVVVNSYNWPMRTRRWIPCVDHPRDGAALEMTVTADAALTVVSNGRLVSSEDGPRARSKVWRWEQPLPMPVYDLHVSAFPYQRVELGTAGNVRAGAWLYPQDVGLVEPLREAPRALRVLSARLGPYVWGDRYDMVEAPICGGAMEDVTVVSFDERELRSRRAAETVVHEAVHHWFGNLVRVRSWNDMWVSESTATYLTGMYLLETRGQRAFQEYMSRAWREAHQAEQRIDRAVRPPDPEVDPVGLFDSITYEKGAWLLHVLRMHVGDDAFWAGLRALINNHAHEAIGIDDYQAAFDEAHGESLSWLFEEQIRFVGHPQLAARVQWDATRRVATVTVEQVQTRGLPVYRLPLEIELRGRGREVQRTTVQVTQDPQSFEIPISEAPARVVLDPREVLYADIRCERDPDCPDFRRCGPDRWCTR